GATEGVMMTKSDEEAIREIEFRFNEAWGRHDADGMVESVTEDAQFVTVNGAWTTTRAQILDLMRRLHGATGPFRSSTRDVDSLARSPALILTEMRRKQKPTKNRGRGTKSVHDRYCPGGLVTARRPQPFTAVRFVRSHRRRILGDGNASPQSFREPNHG